MQPKVELTEPLTALEKLLRPPTRHTYEEAVREALRFGRIFSLPAAPAVECRACAGEGYFCCSACHGSGGIHDAPCGWCGGYGNVETCSACKGTGREPVQLCDP